MPCDSCTQIAALFQTTPAVSLCAVVFKQMLRWFPSSKLLLRASHAGLPQFKFRKIKLLALEAPKLTFQMIEFPINRKKQNFEALFCDDSQN
jgi:hypothetical protein